MPIPDVHPETVVFRKGSVNGEGSYPLPCDIVVERDLGIPMRDGVTLLADLYRPDTTAELPTILVYTMYVKRGGFWNKHFSATAVGVPASLLSGLQAFEAPDPGFWCDNGYAVLYVDARGTAHSGGDYAFQGTATGRDIYDAVEWAAEQSWSNGKIGMNGNSYLAATQWAAAALNPPHLAAIAPWEGLIDSYREIVVRGGIPDVADFWEKDIYGHIYGENLTEDALGENVRRFPTFNAYWADKRAEFSQISVPAYVVASWTSPLHTHGTLQAFREIGTDKKWLRVHNNQEWVDIADPDSQADLLKFFDR
ncbi:CocE/NonD family hydrolase [Streptomyces sp. NPDC046909]|uniref:CocE/NonD family hydrolase n=1 Tax=Streptomyces sp. NPDC046909 TaxID=3155617 RepID=UPI0033F42323